MDLFSGMPNHHLIFKVNIVCKIFEDIHAQQTIMSDCRPFMVDHQNIGVIYFMGPDFYVIHFSDLRIDFLPPGDLLHAFFKRNNIELSGNIAVNDCLRCTRIQQHQGLNFNTPVSDRGGHKNTVAIDNHRRLLPFFLG